MATLTMGALLLAVAFPALPDPEPDERGKGYIGVKLQEAESVRVAQVMPNTPAERAGLQVDDVVLRVGDQTPTSMADMIRVIGYHRPGSLMKLEIRRGEQTLKLKLKVAVRPEDAGPIPTPQLELPE